MSQFDSDQGNADKSAEDAALKAQASRNSAAFNLLFGAGAGAGAGARTGAGTDAEADADIDADSEAPSWQDAEDAGVGESDAASVSQDLAGGQRKKAILRLVPPGALLVYLLKGFIDREDDRVLFESLVRQELEVGALCNTLFLRLIVDQDEGFAYVRSLSDEDLPHELQQRPPRLLLRKALPFYDSFLLILLRQRLLDFEMSGQFGRLVLERSEILTMAKSFIHQVNNDKRLDDSLHKAIDDLCTLGLLGKNKSGISATLSASSSRAGRKSKSERDLERIEVKRIISVLITPEILKQADEILESYLKRIKEGGRSNRLDDDEEEELPL